MIAAVGEGGAVLPDVMSPGLLVPLGQVLLSGSFGWCLVRSMCGSFDLLLAFERLIVAILALAFFESAASLLLSVSGELADKIALLGSRDDLKQIILDAFRKASAEVGAPDGPSSSVAAVLEQAWRTGVWGVMSTAVDWIFLVANFLLECGREVFWKLVLVLFPVACGVYPVFPRMVSNLALYAIELALWMPMLSLVEITTGAVARNYLLKDRSLGLCVVAVELLAIILILLIPSVTHRFLSGAFSGDFDSQSRLIRTAKKAVLAVKTGALG